MHRRIRMEKKTLKEKLGSYIDAHYPIIYMNTVEDDKLDNVINQVKKNRDVYEWNEMNGYISNETGEVMFMEDCTLEILLNILKDPNLLDNTLIILRDIVPYLENPQIVAKLRGIANMINRGIDSTLIFVSNTIEIPKAIEQYVTILEMDYLSKDDIKEIIVEFLEENEMDTMKPNLLEELAIAFKGLTEFEICNLLALAYTNNGEISRSDVRLIFEQKRQMIKKAGILEMIQNEETEQDVGGLDNLKEWLKRKADIFKHMEEATKFGVDIPKGVLIAGVPGCGKSLSAKVAANMFEVPLLRLDMGRLMGKYVGESERNLRKAIALAEAIAPCILWIDELEKAFAGIGGEGGGAEVTTRLLGHFLTWMQEKNSLTFVVATANDITKLPPEMLRKGRFDEIFYIDVPNEDEIKKILQIHIQKRRPQDLEKIDMEKVTEQAKGYSGADLEGVIKDAVEIAYTSGKKALDTEDILEVMKETQPLSKIMEETIEKLKKEYENRKFRNASKGKE